MVEQWTRMIKPIDLTVVHIKGTPTWLADPKICVGYTKRERERDWTGAHGFLRSDKSTTASIACFCVLVIV